MRLTLLAAILALVALPATANGCDTPGGRCETSLGFYRLALPAGAEGPVPALLYLHGWGASSEGAMRSPMVSDATARGYALIAPEGLPRAGRTQRDWGVSDEGTHPRDDLAFLAEVLDDAASRGVDRSRVLVTGFSRGGSMVWDAACRAPGLALAYASVSGAFWQPMPGKCEGPVDLYHIHGWTDTVVPLEGRSVGGGTLTQGDVWAGLALIRRTNGCDGDRADATPIEPGQRWHRTWNCAGGRLDLSVNPGGHRRPAGWIHRVLDWFEMLER